jgi:hypothetical protein
VVTAGEPARAPNPHCITYRGSVAHGVYTDAILPSTRPKPVTLRCPVLASTPNTTYNSARVTRRLALCYNTTTVLRRPLPSPHPCPLVHAVSSLLSCDETVSQLFTLTPSSSLCPIRAFGAVGATAQQRNNARYADLPRNLHRPHTHSLHPSGTLSLSSSPSLCSVPSAAQDRIANDGFDTRVLQIFITGVEERGAASGGLLEK